MGMIQREIDRIRIALIDGAENKNELYAAQQALEWALEPGGIRSPYAMITGTLGGSEDCSADLRPPLSSGIHSPRRSAG